ncbi:MAG TPA: SdrD B-like domain-containing protein [Anaerolineae bacterium]|nr:SdrD B-like domain-containing protein [Anaerolineae bacterium]
MKKITGLMKVLDVFLALVFALGGWATLMPAQPVAAAGNLTLTIIAAPNLVVDSNALSPSTYAPKVATVIAKICNTGDAPVTGVTAYIGDYTGSGSVLGTPGIYPTYTDPLVGGLQYEGTYSFTHLGGAVDATRYMGTLEEGECRYQYWSFEYPHYAYYNGGQKIPTWGVSVKPDDDLWLTFDMWVRGDSDNNGSLDLSTNGSHTMTMRNEISAMANKIKPNGNPSGQWFNTDTSVVYPGETVTTNGILYRLGNVNQGFDNDGDGAPDYNAWLQPFGDPAYDPSCFRLVGVTGVLTVTRGSGNPDLIIPIDNNLYFTNIPPDNTDVRGLVYYKFLALGGACTVPISPYQEVASGSDNEKFNGDYGTGVPALMSYEPEIVVEKNGDPTVVEAATITYAIPFRNESDQASAGLTLSSGGVYAPFTIEDTVPTGLEYVGGSVSVTLNYTPISSPGYTILFSTDSGVTWSTTDPGNVTSTSPNSLVKIRWVLNDPLPKKTGVTAPGGTASFQAKVPSGYITGGGTPFIENCAQAKLGDAPAMTEACTTTMVRGTNSIGDFIWKDQDGDGIQDGGVAEPGLNGVTLKLYWDKNGNGTVDAGEPQVNAVKVTVIDGKLDLDGNGTANDNGEFDAYNIIGGLVDVNGDGAITDADDGAALINGYNVINGYLDMDGDGSTSLPDTGDDGQVTGTTAASQGVTITNGLLSITNGVFAGYNTNAIGRLDINGDGLFDDNDDGTGLIGGFNTGTNAVVLYNVVNGYVDVDGDGVANETNGNDNASLSGNYGFAYLPNAYYIVEVVAADYDITTGYTPTTPKQYAVNLSAGGVNNRTSDFGFGPTLVVDKYLTSANPAYEGENVTFKIDLFNKLPGDGTASGFCQYTIWSTTAGTKDSGSGWSSIANAYDSVNGPNNTYAALFPASNVDIISARGFSLGLPSGTTLRKVEAIYSLYVEGSFNDDTLQAVFWKGATEYKSLNIASTINAYGPGQSKQGIFAWDVTTGFGTWAPGDFNSSTLEVGFYAKKSALGDTTLRLDAMGFRVTTNELCGGADTVIATLPFTDTYDANKLQFVSANPPQTSVTVNGSNSTIHWANLGPLYAGGTKTVQVTFKALDPGANSASTTNYADAQNAYFGNGRKVNDASDNVSVTINATGSIAGTVWSDKGTIGWVPGATGYESLGSTDFPIPGATVTLYGCYIAGTNNLITNPDTGRTCTASQQGGEWRQVGTSLTTDANGYYKFEGLREGYYYVAVSGAGGSESAEAGGSNTNQNGTGFTCGTCDATWGATNQNLNTTNYNPIGTGGASPNEDITNINFGFQNVPARIYGKVYYDNNGDGEQGTGEANANGVSVRLCSDATCTTVLQTATTGSDGSYSFSIPTPSGNYYVQVNNGSPLAGTLQTDDPDNTGTCSGSGCDNRTDAITLSAGQIKGPYIFGYQPTGAYTVGDTIYYDWNGNGSQDTGELGIPNITVYLYEDENNNDTIDTATDALIATRSTMYNVINGYLDVNNDGQITADDDTTMMGVQVVDGALQMADGVFNGYNVYSGRIDVNNSGAANDDDDDATLYGKYAFTNLPNGNYIVVVNTADPDFPTNVVQTDDPDNSGTCSGSGCDAYATSTAISGADDLDNDWGYQPRGQGMIGDTVWLDTNGNGVQNTGESGQPNVTVNLYHDADGDGVIDAATDPLVATTTTLGYSVIDGYIDVSGNGTIGAEDALTNLYGYSVIAGALDIDGSTTIGATDDGYLGPYRVIDGRLDMNNDGSATTADDGDLKGFYLFQNLPAANFIVQVAPAELTTGGDLAGLVMTNTDSAYNASQTSRAVALAPGQQFFDADFGFTSSAIGDLVWQDNNGDGLWQSNEPGIPGVLVELYLDANNDGVADGAAIATATTDANGLYLFGGLSANNYIVKVAASNFQSGGALYDSTTSTAYAQTYDPNAYNPSSTSLSCLTSGAVGCDNTNWLKGVTVSGVFFPGLQLGQNDLSSDFGYKPPTRTIGDTVWIDGNGNNVYDPGEKGIPYITVWLCAAADTTCASPIQTTATDENGNYTFAGLSDSTTYYVKVNSADSDFPSGLTPTYDLDGTGTQHITAVAVGATDRYDVDFGYRFYGNNSISGTAWYDADQGGQSGGIGDIDAGETVRYRNVPVYLWRCVNGCGGVDDILVAVTTTAADGTYAFNNLSDGDYRVSIDGKAPEVNGLTSTTGTSYSPVTLSGSMTAQRDFGFYATVDFGDLPDFYSTTTASGGAGHIVNASWNTLYLGSARQTELDGQPTFDATGDGSEEDGVDLRAGQAFRAGNTLTFDVTITGNNGYLVAFFDWNGDGDFADTGEIVNFANQTAGTHTLTVNIPVGADSGSFLNARFRLYDATLMTFLSAEGLAKNGEVEDYQWKFGSIGDYVWMDLDRDGFQDVGEAGLPNVKVNLYKSDGTTLLASAYTDSDGRYRFESLTPGGYVVKVDTTTLPNGGTNIVNTYDPDQPAGGDSSSGVITLTAGQRVDTADFGYAPSATKAAIGDYIWSDADNDGIQDPGEPGIEGVTVALKDAATGATIATATTDAAGRYLFTNVDPGEYIVDVTDTGGKLSGYTLKVGPQSSTDPTAPIKVRAGDVYLEADFGYYKSGLGSISNQVWLDFDGDGLYEGGETGLGGVQVMLIKDSNGDGAWDAGEPIIATAVTAADGTYAFGGLPLDYGSGNAKYLVVVGDTNVALRDYIKTTGTNATADNYSKRDPYTVTLSSGTPTNVTADFGYRYPLGVNGMIGDRVWYDLDGDGVQDTGEAGIADVTAYLCTTSPCSSGNAIRTTTTDVNGNYYFTNLPAGTYYVKVDTSTLKGGVTVNTYDNDTNCDSESGAIVLSAGQTYLAADFGYNYNGTKYSIGDKVWRDDNANGREDETGTGIPGVTLALYYDTNGNGRVDTGEPLLATTTTDSSGAYTFGGLPNGNYIVDVTDEYGALTGYRQTAGNDPWPVTINNADRLDIDFGYVRAASLGSIGDTVWFDLDGDGVVDPVERGIPGVKVWLYVDMDNDGVFDADDGDGVCETGEDCIYDYDGDNTRGDADDSVLTGHDGSYRFGNLPAGNYFVVVDGDGSTTGNFASGKPLNGLASTTGGQVSAVVRLSEGERYLEADFGYRNSSGTYSIGDYIWADADADGIQDPGEPGIAGVTVELFNSSGQSQGTTTTDAYGYYRFTGITTAGAYYVRVQDSNFTSGQPLEGYTVTTGPESQGNNQSKSYLLNDTTPSIDKVDFGFDNNTLGSIGDFVWLDQDKDGIQDSGEPGLQGVYVDLIYNGNVIATTVTDAGGYYTFTGLKYGDYTVRVEDRDNVLQGMALTTAGSFNRTVSSGTPNHTDADFGFNDPTIGDFVWLDDGNGIQETGESGIQGVKVLLYRDIDGDGVIDPGVDNLIMTRYTNENGYYYFGELPFGTTYIIKLDDSNFDDSNSTTWSVLEGFKTTLQDQGGDNAKDSDAAANLTSGVQIAITTPGVTTEDFTFDFGLLCTTCRTIGDLVWQDLDAPSQLGHGYKDTDESGINGVTLVLYRDLNGDGVIDQDDPVVGKTTTASDGTYSFPNLPPGKYIVQVTDENFVLKGFVWSDGTDDTDNYSQVTTYAVVVTSDDINCADFGFYKYPEAPTAVTLAGFTATTQDDGILLTWETAAELDNAGFNLYRSTAADGPYTLLNDALIPPQFPGEVIGGVYEWLDTDVQPGVVYYYKLEDIDVKGVSTFHGPVTATARAATTAPRFTVFLPVVMTQQ